MKRDDKKTKSDLLFDLPLDPDVDRATPEPPEGEFSETGFVEVQTPLVFESPDPKTASDTPTPAFAIGSPGEPPMGSRFSAAILDLAALLASLAAVLGSITLLGIRPAFDLWPPLVVFLLSFSFLYTVMPLTFWGKTPGMAYAGIVCRGADALPLSIPQSVLRWFGVVIVYAGAGLPALLTLSGVSLSDLLSRSRVVVDERPADTG